MVVFQVNSRIRRVDACKGLATSPLSRVAPLFRTEIPVLPVSNAIFHEILPTSVCSLVYE